MAVDADGLTVLAGQSRSIQFSNISGLSRVRRSGFFTVIETPLQRGFTNVFRGVRSSEANRFTDALNDAWMKHWCLKIEEHSDSISNLAVSISGINLTRNFPAACFVEPYWQKAKEITEWLPMDPI